MSSLEDALRRIIREELERAAVSNPEAPRLAYSVPEIAAMIGVSDQQVYNHMARGDLTAKYSGTKRIVTADEVKRFLRDLPDEPRGPLV